MAVLTTDRLEHLISWFADQVDEPSESLGSVRCLSERTIRGLFTQLRNAPGLQWSKRLTNAELLTALTKSSLLVQVPGTGPPAGANGDRLYAAGLSADPDTLDPLELLMALEPSGFVCHFSAIALHGLSTQIPSHQHVATSRVRALHPGSIEAEHAPDGSPPALGTLRAMVRGTPYYSTKRTSQLVAGVQRRVMSDRLVVRCTTVAQTLIDGLLRPSSCGGPAVVMEAWDNAPDTTTPQAVVDLTRTIAYPPLSRRVGYMIESISHPAWQVDAVAVDTLRPANAAAPVIPLFVGVGGRTIDARWQLRVP